MGLPVVAPARGGPIDLVDHGRSGYLFDPDRPGALREAAATLVADPQLRASMGEVGLARIAQCSWGALTAELVGHYERARVTRRARAPHAA